MKLAAHIVSEIVRRVTFRDFRFRVGSLGDGAFVQACFDAPCTDSGKVEEQRGRKFYVSPYAIEDEVIKTCWLAVELALRHEAMEDFKVDGVAPFHPHTSVDSLIDNAIGDTRVARKEA